jgi:2-polyprenyl-3-methyl-5-hydroxy-6-metoxy-1,4-benzoquinol methylase
LSDQSTIINYNVRYYGNYRPEMMKYIPQNAKRILDVGCNDGSFCSTLKRSDREIWGLEMNAEAAQKATEVCNFVLVGDFNEIFDQLPKNHFDCIIFNDVLEHIYSPWDTIQKVKLLLSPNGVLVSSIPNFRYITNLFSEVIFKGEFHYKPEGGILDDTHIRFFTTKSIRRMFHEQGYEVLIHEGINPADGWRPRLFIFLLPRFLKDIRYLRFATVAKPLSR